MLPPLDSAMLWNGINSVKAAGLSGKNFPREVLRIIRLSLGAHVIASDDYTVILYHCHTLTLYTIKLLLH